MPRREGGLVASRRRFGDDLGPHRSRLPTILQLPLSAQFLFAPLLLRYGVHSRSGFGMRSSNLGCQHIGFWHGRATCAECREGHSRRAESAILVGCRARERLHGHDPTASGVWLEDRSGFKPFKSFNRFATFKTLTDQGPVQGSRLITGSVRSSRSKRSTASLRSMPDGGSRFNIKRNWGPIFYL